MDILRFLTAGNVDDGKSTLIGRLLHDSKSILIDELEAIERNSKNRDDREVDLALLTDGLRAEREQGITIDVAYRYFSTSKRKFIIADTPGHIQYTRNMVTGASNSDLAIILIDARNGVVEQTKRHSIIISLLAIRHVIVAINKMDCVEYSEEVYNHIINDYAKAAEAIGLKDITYIPISAAKGDNVVTKSNRLTWYKGEALLHFLENIEIQNDLNYTDARFPVQYVIRPQTGPLHDYRGYAGKIISGIYRKGDDIIVLPSGLASKIKAIEFSNTEVGEAFAGQSVVLHLQDDVDVSRGDLIVKKNNHPLVAREQEALLCWFSDQPMQKGSKYILQLNGRLTKSIIKEINYRLDASTLQKEHFPEQVGLNDIVKVTMETAFPIAYDPYNKLRTSGGAILIDETSNGTVAACLFQ